MLPLLIGLLSSFFLFLEVFFPFFPSPTFMISFSSPIYLAVGCVDRLCRRGLELYSSWGTSFLREFPDSDIQFFMSANVTLIPGRSNFVPAPMGPAFRSLFEQDFASVRDFLSRQRFAWYIRTTYDVYCYLPNLHSLMRTLISSVNPYTDIVIKGEAMLPRGNKADEVGWVHGGPGWLMSHRAAVEFIKREAALRELNSHCSSGDDVLFGAFVRSLNLTMKDVFSEAFFGFPICKDHYQSFNRQLNFSRIAVRCSRFVGVWHNPTQVAKIAFLHNGHRVNWAVILGRRIIEGAPPWLYLQIRGWDAEFCKSQE
jgi:hypothetical protein